MRLCHPVPIPWRTCVCVCVCVYVCVYRCLCLCDVTQSELWHVALLGALLLKWWLTCVYVCVSVYVSVNGCLCLCLCLCVCVYTSVFTFVWVCRAVYLERRKEGHMVSLLVWFFLYYSYYIFFSAHVRIERYTLNEEKNHTWSGCWSDFSCIFSVLFFLAGMSA